jgi:ATP adenylyltransferase
MRPARALPGRAGDGPFPAIGQFLIFRYRLCPFEYLLPKLILQYRHKTSTAVASPVVALPVVRPKPRAGIEESMKQLWCPWRIDYILGPKPESCVFCLPSHEDEDEERLVLHRGREVFVIMNKFPYNNGHLMVTPFRHVMNICDLTQSEAGECMDLLRAATAILQKCFSPQGINMGLNLGEAAGAGIREHLHFHLVPRWNGDSSFMAVMDEIRVMPEHLNRTYAKLKPSFDALKTTG